MRHVVWAMAMGLQLGVIVVATTSAAVSANPGITAAAEPTSAPELSIEQVRPAHNSFVKAVTVRVHVDHLKLIDPDRTDGKPKVGTGHLHYQLDHEAVIASAATLLSFHALSSGTHTLAVSLAGNNDEPLGPEKDLEFKIP